MTKRAPLPAAFKRFLCEDAVWQWRAASMETKSEYVASLDGMLAAADKALAAAAGMKDPRIRSIAEEAIARRRQEFSRLRAVVPPDAERGPRQPDAKRK